MDKNVLHRFNTKYVIDANGCWKWIGKITPAGYSSMTIGKKTFSGHALSYVHYKGSVPAGLEIDHLCRNRWCVNPDHLEAVTHQTNVLRGIAPPAYLSLQKFCKNGHLLSGDNLLPNKLSKENRRVCRTCHNEKRRKK